MLFSALGRHASWPRGPIVASGILSCLLIACGNDSKTPNASGSGGQGGGGAPGSGGMQGTGATQNTGGGQNTGGAGTGGGVTGTGGGAQTSCSAPVPSANPGNECPGAAPPAITLTTFNEGNFDSPTHLTHPPGDTERVFVSLRRGQVRIFKNGTLLPEPFLDIDDEIMDAEGGDEFGLLAIAFDPNYATTGRVWLHYNDNAGATTVASIEVSESNPDVANLESLQVLFKVDQPFRNHNGGGFAFGPDGCLFIGLGDGGDSDDPQGNGQDLDTLLGNILRIDTANYPATAPGNLEDHIWNYGMRQPWRLSFDRVTGDLYIGDVGQNNWEEVDVEPKGTGHFNYGWNEMEGLHCRGQTGDGGNCTRTGMRLPIAEIDRNVHRAIIGGYVYRGSAIPDMQGRYFYAGYQTRRIFTLVYAGEENGQPQVCDQHEITGLGIDSNIFSFGEDANGELYILLQNGTILRIDPE